MTSPSSSAGPTPPVLHEPLEPADVAFDIDSLAGNYFIAAYPPFSTWLPEHVAAVHDVLRRPAPPAPLGLYVHVPFCVRKCRYCYYLSWAGKSAALVDRYVEAVIEELALYARAPGIAGREVALVYFGGGTPSLLSPAQIRALGDGLDRLLPWAGAREVTFECAPQSVDDAKLAALEDIGVTRVSLGIQTFDDRVLRLNGRVHLANDAERAWSRISRRPFHTLNVDLIAGLLGETDAVWRDSVRRAIDLGADSVTLYQLEVPYNTELFRDLRAGAVDGLAPWEKKRERVGLGFEELERAGYTVVNGYAAVRDPERHPFVYQDHLWGGGDLLGLGVAAFSYIGGAHFQTSPRLDRYLTSLADGELPILRGMRLGDDERLVREMVLGLKTGIVSAAAFHGRFGCDILDRFAAPLLELESKGWLRTTPEEVRLTRDGLLRVDALLPCFYRFEHRGVRYA